MDQALACSRRTRIQAWPPRGSLPVPAVTPERRGVGPRNPNQTETKPRPASSPGARPGSRGHPGKAEPAAPRLSPPTAHRSSSRQKRSAPATAAPLPAATLRSQPAGPGSRRPRHACGQLRRRRPRAEPRVEAAMTPAPRPSTPRRPRLGHAPSGSLGQWGPGHAPPAARPRPWSRREAAARRPCRREGGGGARRSAGAGCHIS